MYIHTCRLFVDGTGSRDDNETTDSQTFFATQGAEEMSRKKPPEQQGLGFRV